MKTNRVFRTFMIIALMAVASSTIAQEYLKVDCGYGKNSLVIPKDQVKKIEFIFKNIIVANTDTVYKPASGFINNYVGYIYSYSPISLKCDSEWADVTLLPDTFVTVENDYYSYNISLSAQFNKSGSDRTAKIKFSSDGAEDLEMTFIQRKYESSFSYDSDEKWDDTPVREIDEAFEWNDTTAILYMYPNFGFTVESYPDWMDSVLMSCYQDGEKIESSGLSSAVVARFKKNNTDTKREGTIVVRDMNNGTLKINVSQKAVNYSSIINTANTRVSGDFHFEFGHPSLLHIRDVMTGDLTVVNTGYDWFSNWATNQYIGEGYRQSQFIWNTYRDIIYQSNDLIENANDKKNLLAVAYTYRAMAYLEAAQMYEFLPNDKTNSVNEAGNDVLNLTLPIVKEAVLPRNPVINIPRATRDEMATFILEDLDNAEKYMEYLSDTKKNVPHLDVVYGLKARLYMWIGDYANAKRYARLAIENNTGHVMTQEECLSKTDGFNTPEPWMWASILTADDRPTTSGILNWTSWMSPEAQFGYNAAGATSMIDAAMYNRINDSDFRKLMFKAPAGHALESKVPYIDAAWGATQPEYTAIKFRPNDGNTKEYKIGAAASCPLMRIEEMYFIEAEAAERLNAGEGKALLENFMQTHRYASYTFPANANAIDEILFQKRVELWGEGLTFFDIKRLDMSVTRGYEGSNHDAQRQFNTNGRPAWMNITIVTTAKKENKAIEGYENPDPSNCYTVE